MRPLNRYWYVCGALICILIGGSIPVVRAEIKSINLIQNPSFEQGQDIPAQWHYTSYASPRICRDTSTSRSGSASLRWENNDPACPYVLITQQVKLVPGRKYEFSAWIKTENLVGIRESGAVVCLEYRDEQGGHVKGGSYPGGQKDTRDWWQLMSYTGPVPQNVVTGSLACYVRKASSKNETGTFTGTAWWDDVVVRPVSFFVTMLRPARKRTVTDSNSVIEYEIESWPEDFGLSFNEMQVVFEILDQNRTVVWSRKIDIHRRTTRVEFDIADITPGIYTIRSAFAVARTHQRLWQWEHEIHRVSNEHSPRVHVDEHGRLIRNGEPMFPVGVFVRQAPVETVAEGGFNCFMSYDTLSSEQMDAAHDAGLGVIYSIKDYYNQIWFNRGGIRHVDDEVPALLKQLDLHRKHPALIAWYVNDEKGPECLPQHRAHYEALNRADPDHPAWSLHYRPEDISMLTDSCEIVGMDLYPVPNECLSTVGDSARETIDQTGGTRALWYAPQIFDWDNYGKAGGRSPTLSEMRCMSWQAICEGATGLIYYSLKDVSADKEPQAHWANIKQMVREINTFAEVLLSIEEVPEIIETNAGSWLRMTVRRVRDTVYIFAVSDGSNGGEVRFQIKADIAGGEVVALGDSVTRTIDLTETGSWTDDLENMQVKIYRITVR